MHAAISVYRFLVTFPQRFGYDPIAGRRYGPAGFHWWYRELFHFLGGLLIGLAARPGSPRARRVVLVLLALGLIVKESSDRIYGQTVIKTFADPSAWLLGFFVMLKLPQRAPAPAPEGRPSEVLSD